MRALGRDMPLDFTEIAFTAASAENRRAGHLGWIRCVVNGALRLDGIALRRTAAGRLTLSFPLKSGRHHYFNPIHDDARLEFEHQVFAALGRDLG